MSIIVTARDIEMVTSDIRYAQRRGAELLAASLIEIGRLLVEAKSMVPHGEWGKYLEERVDYSQSTAENLMKLYREYGDQQESLFDTIQKSQAFANLSYSKLLALTAIPAEERAEFAEKADAENISTRELERRVRDAVAERDEESRQRQQAEEAAEDLRKQISRLEADVNAANAGRDKSAKEVERLQKKVKAAEAAAQAAEEKAAKPPEVSEDVMAQLRAEAAAEAARKAEEESRKLLEEAGRKAAAAEAAAKEAEEKLAAAQKAARLQNPQAAAFVANMEALKADFDRTATALRKVRQEDPETGEKLKQALRHMVAGWVELLDAAPENVDI